MPPGGCGHGCGHAYAAARFSRSATAARATSRLTSGSAPLTMAASPSASPAGTGAPSFRPMATVATASTATAAMSAGLASGGATISYFLRATSLAPSNLSISTSRSCVMRSRRAASTMSRGATSGSPVLTIHVISSTYRDVPILPCLASSCCMAAPMPGGERSNTPRAYSGYARSSKPPSGAVSLLTSPMMGREPWIFLAIFFTSSPNPPACAARTVNLGARTDILPALKGAGACLLTHPGRSEDFSAISAV
mmetsp:Transcript_9930/g.24839  ORF Transcript_9930/g.24839 Transcript_9930/m.24839 type:complete len:252 (+) Transcript_9930:349-1104(+)